MNPDHEQQWDEHENNENTELEIVDLAPQEAYGVAVVAVALVDLSLRIFARVRSISSIFKVSFSAKKAPSLNRKWQQIRLFSPFTCLLLLIIALSAGSAPYQPAIPLTVARPIFSTSMRGNDMGDATFNLVDQGQGNGIQARYSDRSTVVIPGVAMGHSTTPGGIAIWSAAPMPANCAVNNDTDAIYTNGHISLWLVGASHPYSLVHLQHMTSSNLNSWRGWQLLIGILMKHGFTGPVTLTISNQSSGPSPSFHGLLDEPPMTSLIVDLRKVPAYVGQNALRSHIIWSIPLYLPGAGCYTIQTQWPGGTHNLTISAGQ